MITVGTMQLHQPEAPDQMEPFFVGGEYHTDMSRLSSHDHSGGLLGAPVAVTIPDGSITTADLDPSVLAPYALTDGSKPFTGEVTLQADAVVRDALRFGEQGSALAPDATLARTGPGALRADTHLGLGVTPAAWGAGQFGLQLGPGAAVSGATNGQLASLRSNSWTDGTANYALVTAPGALVNAANGGVQVYTAPSVAAGATQTFTQRLGLAATGTLTVTPDAGAAALVAQGLEVRAGLSAAPGSPRLATGAGAWLEADPAGSAFVPSRDNAIFCGYVNNRWSTVYAVAGAINTSSRTVKEGITPLDPARAMQAVRATEAVTFDYVAPERGPAWYDLPDDPEQAEQVLTQRLRAAPLEAAARHQHGFIAEDCDPLFLVGEGQTSPGSSIGVLLAALQHLDSRLAALEGAP